MHLPLKCELCLMELRWFLMFFTRGYTSSFIWIFSTIFSLASSGLGQVYNGISLDTRVDFYEHVCILNGGTCYRQ